MHQKLRRNTRCPLTIPVPAYSITEVEVIDQDGYKRYRELAQAAVAAVRRAVPCSGWQPIVAEGEWPSQQRVVVIEFPSMDQLKTWYDSPEYRPARDHCPDRVAKTAVVFRGQECINCVNKARSAGEEESRCGQNSWY